MEIFDQGTVFIVNFTVKPQFRDDVPHRSISTMVTATHREHAEAKGYDDLVKQVGRSCALMYSLVDVWAEVSFTR